MPKKINIEPRLRFKDDSENNYPDWEVKKFGDIFSFRVTNSYSREYLNYEDGDVKNIHYGDIHTKFNSHFILTKENVPFINPEIELKKISEDNYCKEGDLIIADASEDYEDVGKCIEVINLNNEKVLAGLHTILARPDLSQTTLGFNGHLMQSEKVRLQIKTIAQGSKVLSISATRLSNINLALPCLEEQKKIADFLSAIDEKIENLEKELDELKAYKKGVMQAIFNEDNTHIAMGGGKSLIVNQLCELRFKDDNGNEFLLWEKKKLGEIATINRKNEKLPNSFIYIDLESVVQGQLNKEERINLKDAPSRAQRLLQKNDIIFQMVRPYQKNNFFFEMEHTDYVASTGYAQIRTNENPQFLFQLLHSEIFVTKVIEKCTGTSYPAINTTDLSNIDILIPCLEEQNKIADFLMVIDEKINCCKEEIDNTKGYKKGLLQTMFAN